MNPLKILYVALGFFFFGLGVVGIFLPVLPTTPFMLLAAFFFSKGSGRFSRWFVSTKVYKNYAESFLRHRSMTLNRKIKILALATTVLTLSFFMVPLVAVKVFLVIVAIVMYYYFARHIKTITNEEWEIIKAEEEALKATAAAEETVTLRETAHEVLELHEKVFEEALENTALPVPSKEEA